MEQLMLRWLRLAGSGNYPAFDAIATNSCYYTE
jgi:hypothetical protein